MTDVLSGTLQEIAAQVEELNIKPIASHPGWIQAQEGMYRYYTYIGDVTVVQIVIREYLACEVMWN